MGRSATLRRNLAETTPTNNITWNFINSQPSATTFNLAGPFVGQEDIAFGGLKLNLFVGTDNVFGNQGDSNGNNNNIERIDSVFSASGITVNNTLAFAVFERGPTNGHDGFKIAAITGIDASGNPTSYGPLINVVAGTWGTTSLGLLNTLVTRNNATQPGADATHPSAATSGQVLGGVSLNVIQDLGIPAGAKIFGYSLFSPDTPANANLVNWNSFPTNTNSNSPGGLDPAAYNGVLYHMVPGNPGPVTDWALPANGNISDPTNWTGQATPNSTDTAIINNGTTATLTGSASVANLETGVGYSNANGSAAVNGGNLSATGTIATGVDGTGTLAISNAGTVTDNTTEIGQNPGSNGTVTVDGKGSSLTSTGDTTVGDAGNGALNIANEGTVSDANTTIGNQPGSSGTATIDGTGSKLNSTGDTTVGGGGTGTLNATNGGTISDANTTIGNQPGSSGMATIDGTGSKLNSTGDTTVGGGGTGALNITNGGTVNDTNGTVGNRPGSSGTATVDGNGSQWNNSGTLDVGPGGPSVVDVTNGGSVTADGGTTVEPLGTMGGNGTITTPTLANNGTVAPAGPNNTPGTLTINGNYQQGPGGVLDSEVGGPTSSQADQLKITGTAALNGTLALTSLNNFHPSSGDTYTILTATGGVTGNFKQVVNTLNNSGLTRTDVIAPNGVLVSYLRPAPQEQSVVLATNKPLPTTTLTNAQKNAILVPLVDPTAEQLTALYEIWFSNANTQRFNIESRFDDLAAGSTGFVSNVNYPKPPPTGKEVVEGKGIVEGKQIQAPPPLQATPENRWGVWVTGYGDFVNVEDDGSAKGYNFTTGGVTVGIDYRLTKHFVVGLMGGYAHTWTDLNPSGSVDVDTGWGGLYAGYFDHGFYLDGAVYGGHYTFDSARTGLLGIANGSSEGGELSTYLAGGYDFHLGHLSIGPTAALQYTYASLDGFSENGSVAPVRISSDSQDSLRTDVGFRAWDNLPVGRIVLHPFVRVAWEHEFLYSSLPLSVGLVDIPNAPTKVTGPSLGHDSAVINTEYRCSGLRLFRLT